MKEYKKSEVLYKLEAAFEAGVNKARLMEWHGLDYDVPLREVGIGFIYPHYKDLNEAYTVFMVRRREFVFLAKRYYAERGRDVPADLMDVFHELMNKLTGPFEEEEWRMNFRAGMDMVEKMVDDDEQLEFNF